MTIRALKTKSRTLLRGKYGLFALMLLLFFLILIFCSVLPVWVFPDSSRTHWLILQSVISYLLSVLVGVIGVGISYCALNVSRERSFDVTDLFFALRNSANQFLLIEMLLVGITFALNLLFLLFDAFFAFNLIEYYIALICWSFFSAFVSLLLTIRIRFAIYILMDHPEYGATQALRFSLHITKGQYTRILALNLSFIPIYILAYASFGIGLLFVRPYAETTIAALYDEIKSI